MQNAAGGAFCNTFDLHLVTILSLRSLFCLFLSFFTQVSNEMMLHNSCASSDDSKEM